MAGRAPTAVLETLLGPSGRASLDGLSAPALVEGAEAERVVPLAARALHAVAPGGAHAVAMHAAAAAWALREAAERQAIRDFLDAARGLPLLFVKGAAMAYAVYPSPALRMKDDWDVLAEPGRHAAAARALGEAGFAADLSSKPGRVRVRQQTFRRDVPGSQCIVDLHMRMLNPVALAERIPFADLVSEGVALPALHPAARGLGDEAALVLACLHRLAHHPGELRLAWDYDVLLLARRARPDHVARAAERWAAGPFVAAETRRVLSRFGEPMPPALEAVIASMETADSAGRPDAAFLAEPRSRAREFALDWRGLNWRDRAALIGETVLPDAAFVRASTGSTRPLPWLYARRVLRGLRGWFRAR